MKAAAMMLAAISLAAAAFICVAGAGIYERLSQK